MERNIQYWRFTKSAVQSVGMSCPPGLLQEEGAEPEEAVLQLHGLPVHGQPRVLPQLTLLWPGLGNHHHPLLHAGQLLLELVPGHEVSVLQQELVVEPPRLPQSHLQLVLVLLQPNGQPSAPLLLLLLLLVCGQEVTATGPALDSLVLCGEDELSSTGD